MAGTPVQSKESPALAVFWLQQRLHRFTIKWLELHNHLLLNAKATDSEVGHQHITPVHGSSLTSALWFTQQQH